MHNESLDEEIESTKDETKSTTMEEDEGKVKKLIRGTPIFHAKTVRP